MHLCFILENSLTMLQKTNSSELNIFDQIRHSLENVVKNVFKTCGALRGKPTSDLIHLFVTSSTEPVSSFANSHQFHILHQLKNLQCTVPTFPAEVIEAALHQVGKFKCLNETETCLGYREGIVSEPAFIFYITDNSNSRQIQKINQKIIEEKFHLRAEYKFVTIKYCGSSPHEAGLNTREKFKSFIENQKESLMMEEVMRKINGKLFHVYSSEELTNCVQGILNQGIETLTMGISNKEYKIHNKEIINVQFPTQNAEQKYFQRIKSLKKQSVFTKFSDQSSVDLFINCIQTNNRPAIPLPHEITPSIFFCLTKEILSDGKIIIDEFKPVKYFIDFTKEYVGSIGQGMKLMRNTYVFINASFEIVESKELFSVFEDLNQEKKIPLFYEREKIQYLIGYLRVYIKQGHNSNFLNRAFELCVSFSNFTNLNATIRSYLERNPSSEQYFQNYISTLPLFYHKTLKYLLSYTNISLSPQTQRYFDGFHNKQIGATNMKLYEQRVAEMEQMNNLLKESIDQHMLKTSKCCSIYSESFQQSELQRSKNYQNQRKEVKGSELDKFLQETIKKINLLQPSTFKYSYLTLPKIHVNSMASEVKKYSNIRRNDDDDEKMVGGICGNPFKKLNKKVKLYVEAESVWIEPEEIGMMKVMLANQMQTYFSMESQLTLEEITQMDQVLKMDSIYDKLAAVKLIISNALLRIDQQKNATKKAIAPVVAQKETNKIETKSHKHLQEISHSPKYKKTVNPIEKQIRKDTQKIIEQKQQYVEMSTQELNEEEERFMYSGIDQKDKNQQNFKKQNNKKVEKSVKPRKQSDKMVEESSETVPEIIREVNSKFQMGKSSKFQIPAHLVQSELYSRNKGIIAETLMAFSYLGQGSK